MILVIKVTFIEMFGIEEQVGNTRPITQDLLDERSNGMSKLSPLKS